MSEGGSANQINALIDAERLAAANRQYPDPADERAERMTTLARIVVGAAATVGFTWFVGGAAAGLVALAITGALGLGFVLWRRRSSRSRQTGPA